MASTPQMVPRPRVLQWNCRALRPRLSELHDRLQLEEYDVLALQEVYLQRDKLHLPGYIGCGCRTSCQQSSCKADPCFEDRHPRTFPRSHLRPQDSGPGGDFESWEGICASLVAARGSARAWHLFRSLLEPPIQRAPYLAIAVAGGITYQQLADKLAEALLLQGSTQGATTCSQPADIDMLRTSRPSAPRPSRGGTLLCPVALRAPQCPWTRRRHLSDAAEQACSRRTTKSGPQAACLKPGAQPW
ncbi:uncharacterized protein LOC144109513 [Amblyomma americanum]